MAVNGKIALVTGAAQGLGRGFCEILLKNGAKVALLDVNKEVGNDLKASLDKEFGPDHTLFLTCDVTSEDQLSDAYQKTLEKFGKIDIVCNNAGIANERDWEKAVAVNLVAVVRSTYLALQHMKKQNGGQGGLIVNIASMAGLGPLLTSPVYTATKHGVVGFSRALAEASEACDFGVRLKVLCPTFVRTAIISTLSSEEYMGLFSCLHGFTEQMIGMFGMLEVPQVAEAFLQLVVEEGKNGSVLMVTPEITSYVEFPKSPTDVLSGNPSPSAPGSSPQ
ncbi:hypothetical protein MATL_G00052700 [Megalops atlanticus]|uniref:15-hydroxyprostaglandin dehydrogenase [NAD(+)] n=1 Tax=Megalops atlanticus TaxID=7932 RepID=A0A9D3THE9_MEGAT|nr:hypothetical protein MATL_G00052700 [Megalops atlanticus]